MSDSETPAQQLAATNQAHYPNESAEYRTARNALLTMIDHLTDRGWTPQQAYAICSVAVDLKISQLVDVPNMLVSAFLPEDIFTDG